MRSSRQARQPSSLKPWYGIAAYAKDGKVLCFFQSAQKFNSRYATFSFSDKANLDEGTMWPTSFGMKELTATDEGRIVWHNGGNGWSLGVMARFPDQDTMVFWVSNHAYKCGEVETSRIWNKN